MERPRHAYYQEADPEWILPEDKRCATASGSDYSIERSFFSYSGVRTLMQPGMILVLQTILPRRVSNQDVTMRFRTTPNQFRLALDVDIFHSLVFVILNSVPVDHLLR